MTRVKPLASMAAMTAALSIAAAPVMATDLPVAPPTAAPPAFDTFDAASENADRYRRYRHHRNRGVDAGDVIAGVLILGGIAAIASAASEPRRSTRTYPQQQRDYQPRRSDNGRNMSQGLDRAVDMCLQEIERDVRVDRVDSVDRTGAGWNVTGRLYDGEAFACQIGNNGQVSNISYSGSAGAFSGAYNGGQTADRQYSAQRYAEMRRQADSQGIEQVPNTALPAYPGGPVNGQYYDEDGFGG
ncbi:hypothetical protein [Pontixanthobacter sp.]|uniref:hypothetical protein n=1 Tax=Pontixanthobacter sp. TaxID=2792078 RepID=UPI003C7B521A